MTTSDSEQLYEAVRARYASAARGCRTAHAAGRAILQPSSPAADSMRQTRPTPFRLMP